MYSKTEFEGKILKVEQGIVKDFVHPKAIEKFKQPEAKAINLTVESNGTEIKQFYTIPKVQGYMKSNLKKLIERNKLPLNTEKWIGKTVTLVIDAKGYMRIAL